jgi:GST-like protein
MHLYTAPTPNGHKVSIALEELEIPYEVHLVNILAGEQFAPEFLKISPNNKIPALVDEEAGLALFESGAILLYLAEKYQKLIPQDTAGRYLCIQWLMFQMGGLGPMLGQAHHFRNYAPEPIPYAIDRYTNEAHRLYRVMDARLGEAEFLAGSYSIADIACFPWIRPYKRQGQELDEFPNLKRWFLAIKERPAVRAGLKQPPDFSVSMDADAKKVLFGQK